MLRDSLENKRVISENQLGSTELVRRCQVAKQQALINKVSTKRTTLCDATTCPEVLQKSKVPDNIVEFVKRMLKHEKTSIDCTREEIAQVKIENWLAARRCSLAFVVCDHIEATQQEVEPKLREGQDGGGLGRNNLIFIDAIILLAETEGWTKHHSSQSNIF